MWYPNISKKEAKPYGTVSLQPFGVTRDGEKVNEYIMSNPGGLAVSVLNYAA